MRLYGNLFSNNARKVHLLCEELGIEYDYRSVDLAAGEQRQEWFLALNPNGMVPVIDDGGLVLWESQAILRYLATKHGAVEWYPTGLGARACVEQWLDWNQTRLGPSVEKIAFHTLFAGERARPEVIEEGRSALREILPVLERAVLEQPYMCGEGITIADLALVPNISYLDICRVDLGRYPAIAAWYRRVRSRPSFARTAPPF